MDLKIVMSTTFYIIRMSIARPFIRYNVDEVVDVNDEIIQQIIKWDWDETNFGVNRAIVYCLT